jgi:hypothetical protein
MEVLGGVLVGRGIAAAHVTTGEAKPEVDPPALSLEALFAAFGSVGCDRPNLVDVGAMHGLSALSALERRTVPACQIGTGLIGGLEELVQHLIGPLGRADGLVG